MSKKKITVFKDLRKMMSKNKLSEAIDASRQNITHWEKSGQVSHPFVVPVAKVLRADGNLTPLGDLHPSFKGTKLEDDK